MSRTLHANVQTEVEKQEVRTAFLLDFFFDSGNVRVTDAWKSIDWGGNTYNSSGDLINIDGLEEALAMRNSQIRITLSAVNQASIATALSEEFTNRRVDIYLAFVDASHTLIGDPVALFTLGRINNFDISETPQDTAELVWTVSADWAAFERITGRRTNTDIQQLYYATDEGFKFASQIIKEIKWGEV